MFHYLTPREAKGSSKLIPPMGLLQTNMGLNPLHATLLKDSNLVAAPTQPPTHSPFLGAVKVARYWLWEFHHGAEILRFNSTACAA